MKAKASVVVSSNPRRVHVKLTTLFEFLLSAPKAGKQRHRPVNPLPVKGLMIWRLMIQSAPEK